ncbi:MAG: DHH family phosphoesterase [Thomasclavelia sp.]|nr:DHH family phosphoesterase [Thomasclavelia sp.]
MIKKLVQLRNVFIALLVLEMVIVFSVYTALDTEYTKLLLIYVVIKNLILIGAIVLSSRLIETNNLSVSTALNEDSNNALLFGGVALIKYDENRNIVWVSDLFQEKDINIVGRKLLEWQPLLAPLFEDEDVQTIDILSRKYEAYNSKSSRLVFLKDVTDYMEVSKAYEDQHMVFAYISIDNYDDSIEYAQEDKAVQIQTTAVKIITDWAKTNGIILKKYKADAYIAVFNERIYTKQVNGKFSILDQFRSALDDLGQVMSLSIGIGRGTQVVRELDELAFNALSMSFSRGGDQVVVKSLDEPIRYFGGNSESSETSNRVRARVIAQTLSSLIKQADNVIIMGHKQSDFDSFGASVSMHTICNALQVNSYIALDFESLEDKTYHVATELASDMHYKDVIVSINQAKELVTHKTLLVCVDNHKPSLAISKDLIDIVRNKVIIDHHRRGEEFIELPILTYLEPAASSTVELLVELFDYLKVEINVTQREATIMYAGMLIDTNYLKTRVGSRTFLAAAKLKDMSANVSEAYEYLKDDFTTTLTKYSIMESAYQFGNDILIAYGKENETYTRAMLAKAGNELINVSDIKAAFTIGKIDSKGTIALSARSNKDINVQLIMEKLGGGGHFSMAACQISDSNIVDVTNRLEEAINEYLDERS